MYYKFKSARDYDSISMDGPFISVGTLKEKIFETKHRGRGTDFDLVVTNAQTNEGWFLFSSLGYWFLFCRPIFSWQGLARFYYEWILLLS